MELDGAGEWKTLEFLRGKHQLFVVSLEAYRPSLLRSKSVMRRSMPDVVKMLRHLSGKDWDGAVEELKEASERQAIMHLFACFERIIRVDALIRGELCASQYHACFVEVAGLAHAFVRFDRCLQCWVDAASAAGNLQSVKELRQIKQLFRDERNKLMHNDLTIVPPFSRIARHLHSSLMVIRHLASDFPLQCS
jgi:hypothetical protein